MDYGEADLANNAVSRQNAWKERTAHEEGDRRMLRDTRGRDRDHDRRPRRFSGHTRLNTSRAEILAECANAEFKDVRPPDPLVLKEGQKPSKRYCHYHRSNVHDINDCMALKDDIEELIQRRKLRTPQVEGKGNGRSHRGRSPRRSPKRGHRERSPRRSPRKGKAIVNEVSKKAGRRTDSEEEPNTRRSKGRQVAMVILGGDLIEVETNKSVKRRWKEIMNVASSSSVCVTTSRSALSFGDEDLLDGKPNKHIPLLITVVMANIEVRRILVDQGSSVDVMFVDLLDVLKISWEELKPYRGTDLTGFNGSTTTPLGYMDLMVAFGDDAAEHQLYRTVETSFLVLPCKSVYQCIIGRPTLGKLGAVTSTVHLKMKFHSMDGEVVTLPADLHSARRFHFMGLKEQGETKNSKDSRRGSEKGHHVNVTDLDARYDPDSEEEEDHHPLAKELKKKLKRPEPDGQFELVQLRDDPTRTVSIGADLPSKGRTQLVSCLKEHADLFAWSAADMPAFQWTWHVTI